MRFTDDDVIGGVVRMPSRELFMNSRYGNFSVLSRNGFLGVISAEYISTENFETINGVKFEKSNEEQS